jgi:hypothetical protein
MKTSLVLLGKAHPWVWWNLGAHGLATLLWTQQFVTCHQYWNKLFKVSNKNLHHSFKYKKTCHIICICLTFYVDIPWVHLKELQ